MSAQDPVSADRHGPCSSDRCGVLRGHGPCTFVLLFFLSVFLLPSFFPASFRLLSFSPASFLLSFLAVLLKEKKICNSLLLFCFPFRVVFVFSFLPSLLPSSLLSLFPSSFLPSCLQIPQLGNRENGRRDRSAVAAQSLCEGGRLPGHLRSHPGAAVGGGAEGHVRLAAAAERGWRRPLERHFPVLCL